MAQEVSLGSDKEKEKEKAEDIPSYSKFKFAFDQLLVRLFYLFKVILGTTLTPSRRANKTFRPAELKP